MRGFIHSKIDMFETIVGKESNPKQIATVVASPYFGLYRDSVKEQMINKYYYFNLFLGYLEFCGYEIIKSGLYDDELHSPDMLL